MIHPVMTPRATRIAPTMTAPRFGAAPAINPDEEFAGMVLDEPASLSGKKYLVNGKDQTIATACFNLKVQAGDPKVADALDMAAKESKDSSGVSTEYLFRKALGIRLAAFGENHPKVGESYYNLGRVISEHSENWAPKDDIWKPLLEKALTMLEPDSLPAADAHYLLAEGTGDIGSFNPNQEIKSKGFGGEVYKYTPERETHLLAARDILSKKVGSDAPLLHPVLDDLRSIYQYVKAQPQVDQADNQMKLISLTLFKRQLEAQKAELETKIAQADKEIGYLNGQLNPQ